MTRFVVIGGGIAGVSAAAHLAPHGPLTLLESEPTLAYHTSGRSAAMLVENYGSDGARPLVKAARPFLESPPPGSVDNPLLSDRAVVWVAGRGDLPILRERAAAAQERGASCVILTPDQVVDLVPAMRLEWLDGGLHEPSGADIDVAGLHQAFVRIARSHDADIIPGSPVTAIDHEAIARYVQAKLPPRYAELGSALETNVRGVLYGAIFVFVNMVVDITYGWIDPRIRRS